MYVIYRSYKDGTNAIYGSYNSMDKAVDAKERFFKKFNATLQIKEVHIPEHPIFAVYEFHDMDSVFFDLDNAKQRLQEIRSNRSLGIYDGDTGDYIGDLPEEE